MNFIPPDHRHPPNESAPDPEGGYLLLELVAVVAILTAIAASVGAWTTNWIENRQITVTERGLVTLAEAVYNYRMTHANPGEWPGSMADLATYAPTFAADGGRNGVGQPYRLDPPARLADPIAPMILETDLLDADRAERVRREFPNTGTVRGTMVRVEVPVPGHEPARNALLARDGTREMTGTLDLDRHNIEDVGRLTTDQMTVDGQNLTLGGSNLSRSGVDFLNRLASLSCGGGQALRIAGGSPGCVNLPAPQIIRTPPPIPTSTSPPRSACGPAPTKESRLSGLALRADFVCTQQYRGNTCTWSCRTSCGPGDDHRWYDGGFYGRSRSPFLDNCSFSRGCRQSYRTSAGTCYVGGGCVTECRQVR